MTQLNASSHGSRRNSSSRAAQASASQPVASEIDTLVCNIHERRQLRSQTAVERVLKLVRIGGDLARLKEVSKEQHPDWNGWVQQEFRYTSTQSRQLIQLHQKWGAWAETVAARPLLERVPCDLPKLEWLCQLPADDLGRLLDSNDCHALSVIALRKEVQARLRVVSLLKDFNKVIARADTQVPDLTAEQRALLAESLSARAIEALCRWGVASDEEDEEDEEDADSDSDSGEGEQEVPAAARAADREEPEADDDSGDDEDEQVDLQQNDDHDDDEDEDRDEDDDEDDEQPAPRPRRRGS